MVKLRRRLAFNSFICHNVSLSSGEKCISSRSLHLYTFLFVCKVVYGLLTFPDSCFNLYIRHFQIFRKIKLSKFAWWMFAFLVHVVSVAKYQYFRYKFLCEEWEHAVITRFLFVVLVKFAGFWKKSYTSYDGFHGNGPYSEIPTKKLRTNQNAQIYLKTNLSYNKLGYLSDV